MVSPAGYQHHFVTLSWHSEKKRERERFSERIGRVSACLRLRVREREKERKKSISEISDLNSGESESIT